MLRLYVLLLAITSISIYSCKKSDPPKPTTDFREKYKGTFNITRISVNSYSPPPPDSSTTSIDTLHFSVSVDYSIDDSIKHKHGGYNITYPAVTFTYTDGKQEKYGMNDMGRLYYPNMNSENDGGFIGTDSISHYHSNSESKHSRYNWSTYGTRQK